MIVNVRLEVTDEQRNAIAVLSNPKAVKRLAGREEVTDIVRTFFTAFACGDNSGLASQVPGASESIEPVGLKAVLAKKRGAGWSEDCLASYKRVGLAVGRQKAAQDGI